MAQRNIFPRLVPYFFLIGPLILYLIWVIGPMFYTIYLSFTTGWLTNLTLESGRS